MFANVFYAGLVTLPHIRSLLFPLPLFVSFTIFRMPSEVNKKNMLFVRNFAILKSFLNRRDFHFLYILKWSQKFQICFFFFLSNTKVHKFCFLLMILFSVTSAFFRILFKIKPTQRRSLSDSLKSKVPQLILYMRCYFSQECHKTTWITPF